MTTKMVRKFTQKIVSAELHGKTRNAIEQEVWHFLHHVGLLPHVSTHTLQRSPVEADAASLEFMEFMGKKSKT